MDKLLDENVTRQVGDVFGQLSHPVQILFLEPRRIVIPATMLANCWKKWSLFPPCLV